MSFEELTPGPEGVGIEQVAVPATPAPAHFVDAMSLGEARKLLRTMLSDGHVCPLCTQYAKVYKRTIHATMACELIRWWREVGFSDGFKPDVLGTTGGDFTKLRHWGLIRPVLDRERDDGSWRNGWWAIEPRGRAFLERQLRVPKYAHIYGQQFLRLSGPERGIEASLGDRFDYAELMAA